MSYGWSPYVPVAERRAKAARTMAQLARKGQVVSPVVIEGRAIARTFWGKAWCENMEAYSDFANRLPRGRTYVRNGSVVDLQIGPGEIIARVAGSELYTVRIQVKALPPSRWKTLCLDCSGAIHSLVELLQGRFSKAVMACMCRREGGLFPSPSEITLDCSCPDGADMCKHVAAVLYGIGARLDTQPELLFRLRQVDGTDLITQATRGVPLTMEGPGADKVLADDDLSELFGLELETAPSTVSKPAPSAPKSAPARRTQAKAGAQPTPEPMPAPAPRKPGRPRKQADAGPVAATSQPKAQPGRTRKKPSVPTRSRKGIIA